MEPYESKEYRGYTIKIEYDQSPDSPREWDNFGTIYSNSRSYNPDDHKIEEILNDEKTGLSQYFKENYIWLKVRGYEHSGLTISVSGGYPYNDPWDSGLFGIIAVTKEKAIEWYGKKILTKRVREKAIERLTAEVETLDQYYRGDVYGFVVEDPDGDEIESCWGFYGDDGIKDAYEDAKAIINSRITRLENLHAERIEKVKTNIERLIGSTFFYAQSCYRVSRDMFNLPVLEMATIQKGRVREGFYHDIRLSDIPEPALENMASLIR